MSTVDSYLSMINEAGALSPETMRAVKDMSSHLSRITPQLQKFCQKISLMYVALNPQLQEAAQQAARQAQEISQSITPIVLKWQQTRIGLEKCVTPAMLSAAEKAVRMQIELQPLLKRMCEANPSPSQFSELLNTVSDYAGEDFGDGEANKVNNFTASEKLYATQMVEEIVSKPADWQQEIRKKISVAKEQNPVYASVIIWVLSSIIAIILGVVTNIVSDTVKTAKLREEPTMDAPVVTIINVSQTVNVIDDAPYYYKVEYTNSETGEAYTGWISKRSVQEYLDQTNQESVVSPSKPELKP